MARVCPALLVLLLGVVLSQATTPYPEYPAYHDSVIHSTIVQGYVYCQNCARAWSRHLPGAEVLVQCKRNVDGYVVAQGTGVSKANGYVEVSLAGYNYKKHEEVHTCLVKLVRSSAKDCDYRTNINNGYSGAKPVFAKFMAGVAYYTTNGFAFTPMCSYS